MPRNRMLATKFDGDLESYKEYMRTIAAKGGKKKVSKGRYGGKKNGSTQ